MGSGTVPAAALRDTGAANFGADQRASARVERSWTWRPAPDAHLVVWATCIGSGSDRACDVAVGRVAGATIRQINHIPVGWSLPLVSDGPDRQQLLLVGDDGRGQWRQLIRYEPENGGIILFARRMNGDGL